MKVPQGLSRIEMETFFRTDAASKEWEFYSRDPKFLRKMKKRGYELKEDHQGLWSVKIPLSALSIRSNPALRPKRERPSATKGQFLPKSLARERENGAPEAI